MQIFQRYSIFTFLIFISSHILLQAQVNIIGTEPIHEEFEIVTDRDIYCVGETMQFSIYNTSSKIIRENNWSSVIYVELIKNNGEAIVQQKLKLDNWGCFGNMELPASILSGNYYLRAYTRWMRNFTPTDYAYQLITILNPFNDSPLADIASTTGLFNIEYKNNYQTEQSFETINKNTYQQRDSITIGVNAFVTKNQIISPVCIGVAHLNNYSHLTLCKKKQDAVSLNEVHFLSEPHGITISGKVVDGETNEPVPYATVKMSLLNKNKEQPIVLTNNEGNFYIELPNLARSNEIFASASSNLTNKDLKLLIDNDFCTTPIHLPFRVLYNDTVQYELLNSIAHHYQIQKIYSESAPTITTDTPLNQADTLPFYGTSTQTIRFNKYITMPTLTDYFNELLPNVRIVNIDKKPNFKILGSESELSIYPPIVMIDGVAISDYQWLLLLSPKKIERIEIVDKPYYYGDLIHGGIISLFSEDGNFTGEQLSESGLFFEYRFLSKPILNNTKTTQKHIPELNSTLYWNIIDYTNSNATISFSTGDRKGQYAIKMTGMNSNGKLVNAFTYFNVE